MTSRTTVFRASALAALASALMTFGSGTAPAQAQDAAISQSFSGTLTMEWGDPRPHDRGANAGVTRFHLTDQNNNTFALDVPAEQQSSVTQLFNQRVVVQGKSSGLPSAAAGGDLPRIAVDHVTAVPSAAPVDAPLATTGTRKVLYLLLKYKSDTQTPHTVQFFKDLTNPLTPTTTSKTPMTINGFYHADSYGKLKWSGVVGGNKYFTLPKTKAQYAPCMNFGSGCTNANLNLLRTDALAIADANGIDWKSYDNINFVVNNDLDCCAWGGSFSFNGKTYGATYEPPWAQEAATYVHEFGHSLGLPHSGWRYEAYDSPWDEMSNGSYASYIVCGTYKSANSSNATNNIYCYEPGAGYIAPYKDKLGWLPSGNVQVINAKGTFTVTLYAGTTPLAGTRKKYIKLCTAAWPCTGSSAHFYSIEVKAKAAKPSKGIPNEGVIIHDVKMNRTPIGGSCFFNSQSGWAVPIDATPNDYHAYPTCSWDAGKGLQNAQFMVGKTYSNSTYGIKIKIDSKGTNTNGGTDPYYKVTVTRSK